MELYELIGKNFTKEEQKESLQLEAVRNNRSAIKYIKNPSEQVQLEAIRNGADIKYIEEPFEKVQLEAVRNNGCVIYYINNPSERVQLEGRCH